MRHIHHIIPKHAGGTDDPSNLISLTIEEHAEAHRILHVEHGRVEDKVAWLSLLGSIPKQETIAIVRSIGAKAGGKAYKEKVKALTGDDLVKYKERMAAQSALAVAASKKKYNENGGIWWEPSIKAHNEDALNKMRGPRPQSAGNKNSQYGTCWVKKDCINKKIKNSELDDYITNGWLRGRVL